MKDLVFALIMVLAGVFCALTGHEVMFYVGGVFAVIGVVAAFVFEFGNGMKKDPIDTDN